jgi:hypothetical protein
MDWSAVFAGIAALTSITGLVYSVQQHRDNIRKEFILWALEQMQSPDQREARSYLWHLHRTEKEKQALAKGIESGSPKTFDSKEYSKIRSAFALFDQIGYFWFKAGYANIRDIQALFPQILRMWNVSKPYIEAIRSRPHQEDTFAYFELLAKRLEKVNK